MSQVSNSSREAAREFDDLVSKTISSMTHQEAQDFLVLSAAAIMKRFAGKVSDPVAEVAMASDLELFFGEEPIRSREELNPGIVMTFIHSIATKMDLMACLLSKVNNPMFAPRDPEASSTVWVYDPYDYEPPRHPPASIEAAIERWIDD